MAGKTLQALFEGVEGVSESLLDQLTPLFEAKVHDGVQEQLGQINEQHQAEIAQLQESHQEKVDELQTQLDEAVAFNINESNAQIAQKLDTFLEGVVVEWANENSVALQEGAIVDSAATFFASIQEAATSMNVQLPEQDMQDELGTLQAKNENYRDRLNDALQKVSNLSESVVQLQRDNIVTQIGEGMTLVGRERLAEKCQTLTFENEDNFKSLVEAQKFIIEKEKEDKDPEQDDKGDESKGKSDKKDEGKKPMNESYLSKPVDPSRFRY